MTKDLTKGSPLKLILFFMIPVLIGSLFQQFYNMADSIIVDRAISSSAMAGINSTGSLGFLVIGFTQGLTSGFAVRTSQRFGAGDEKGVKKSVAASLELCLILGIVMTAVTMPLTGKILRLMQTPEDCFDYAYWYALICFAGISATVFYNLAAATLRAVGDTKTPLVILVASAVLNIGLNFLFILVFHMEYTGVAVATIISQFLSGAGGILYMLKRYPILRPSKEDWKIDFSLWKGHVIMGLPMALQYSITAIGCIFQQSALNSLDYPASPTEGIIKAYTAACKINGLLGCLFESLGLTLATYTGQNFGAKEYGRIKDGVFAGLVYTLLLWAVTMAVAVPFGGTLSAIFFSSTKSDPALYHRLTDYAGKYLIYQGVFYGILGLVHVYRNPLQGMNRSGLTMVGGILELVGRAAASFGLVAVFGYTGICISNSIAWLAADVFLVPAYYIIAKKYPAERVYSVKKLFIKSRKPLEKRG